uniref:Uncharacterized protein n=1 Tax=Glycine max TaxID=3847 RepID=C6TEE5_SOYBN|nr:unknown [Glycine max]
MLPILTDSTSLCKWMMLENNLSNQKVRKIMFKAINSTDRQPYYGLALQYMIIDDILFCEQIMAWGKDSSITDNRCCNYWIINICYQINCMIYHVF